MLAPARIVEGPHGPIDESFIGIVQRDGGGVVSVDIASVCK